MDLKINEHALYELNLGISQSVSPSVSSLISCPANYLPAKTLADSQEEYPSTSTKAGQLSPSQSLIKLSQIRDKPVRRKLMLASQRKCVREAYCKAILELKSATT